jgi:hypothetical protein
MGILVATEPEGGLEALRGVLRTECHLRSALFVHVEVCLMAGVGGMNSIFLGDP